MTGSRRLAEAGRHPTPPPEEHPATGRSTRRFRPLTAILISLVQLYRLTLSGHLPVCCRYYPSCSAYGLEALRRHGALRGGWLTVRRLLRCQPWGGSGYDPVPLPKSRKKKPADPRD